MASAARSDLLQPVTATAAPGQPSHDERGECENGTGIERAAERGDNGEGCEQRMRFRQTIQVHRWCDPELSRRSAGFRLGWVFGETTEQHVSLQVPPLRVEDVAAIVPVLLGPGQRFMHA